MSEFNLSAWALKNRSVIAFFMLLALIAGILAYFRLGRSEDPTFIIKTMVVQAAWPGATVDDTLKQVTERLERKLQETPKLDFLRSFTTAGMTTILSAMASALLMFHFLRCLLLSGPQDRETSMERERSLAWLMLALASVLVPYALLASLDVASWQNELATKAIWDGLWPILAGGLLAIVHRQWGDRLPRMRCNVREANQAAVRISRRVGDAATSIDQYLSQWPAAGMMFVGLLLALAGALLLGR